MVTDKYHLVGIGGAGMSAVAELLVARGIAVSGSDRADSPALTRLRALGITVHVGHDVRNVPEGSILVYSSAIHDDNPEFAVAKARGQEIVHRSVALARVSADKKFVAVAGAHGKTTTSAMIATILTHGNIDPSFAIGSAVLGVGTGAHLGNGEIFVAEADESDESFLNYSPTLALVTNVEPDHLDHYGNAEEFEEVFFQFASKIRTDGIVLCCAEDEGAMRLANRCRNELGDIYVYTYGRGGDIALSEEELAPTGAHGIFSFDDTKVSVRLSVSGRHNLLNACGAWAACVLLGMDPHTAAAGINVFGGTSRRFELVGESKGRRLYDDYAHHPTEVAALVEQARTAAGSGRLIVVFQPHLYSRTQTFAKRFAEALSGADQVFLADIYGAREQPREGISSQLIADLLPGAQYVPGASIFEIGESAAAESRSGDIVVLVGAGNITEAQDSVLKRWAVK